MKLSWVFLGLLFVVGINCANILIIQHATAYSHYIIMSSIAKALVNRGHNVTLASPFSQKEPLQNLEEIVFTGIIEESEKMREQMLKSNIFILLKMFTSQLFQFSERMLTQEHFKELLGSEKNFDLEILERFLEEPFAGLAYHYNAPLLLVSTFGVNRMVNINIGNPVNPSYVPEVISSSSNEMNFWERVVNTLGTIGMTLLFDNYCLYRSNEIVQKYFPNAPNVWEIERNVSLYLINSHPSFLSSIPYVSNMIDIGGFHIEEPKPLPGDIKQFLDNATDGAIYFSMGSNLKGTAFPEEKRKDILRVFSKLKQKVLWKFEEELPHKLENVKTGKWFPQQDVLAHPNVKLFITHGGLLSTIEAIYHGVPLLGIPVFGDQALNVKQAVRNGYALHVGFDKLNEGLLSSAVNDMLSDSRYTDNAKDRSRVFHDRPMKPMDTAMYWIEYVIRNRGAPHLRSVTTKLKWYQLMLLDVLAFLIFCSYVGFKLIVLLFRLVKRLLSRKVKND